jgi:hypothetical protein
LAFGWVFFRGGRIPGLVQGDPRLSAARAGLVKDRAVWETFSGLRREEPLSGPAERCLGERRLGGSASVHTAVPGGAAEV